ncbi:MAG: methyl-accepting chemotaxis protein [Prochloraceae cyanobacterium]|nr:methyl-accepting chemotaxis protein [Prochloraceae cyanobacterium]
MTQTPFQPNQPNPLDYLLSPFQKQVGSESNSKTKDTQSQGLWSKLSLRVKATAIAIALGVIPVASVGGIAYKITADSISRKIIAEQEGRTADIAHEVALYTKGILHDTKMIASSPLLADPKLRTIATMEQKIALLNDYIQVSDEKYDSIVVFDPQGNLLFQSESSTPFKENDNYSDREYFQRAIATGSPAINDGEIAASSEESSLEIAAPIKEKGTGKLLGVIRTRMPLKHLNSTFENIKAAGWEYKLIGSKGQIIWADEQQYIGHLAGVDLVDLSDLQAKVLKEAQTISKVTSKTIPQLIATEKTYDASEDDRHKVLVSYIPIEKLQGILSPGWGLAISRPTEEAFASLNELRTTLFLGTAAAAVMVGTIAAILANRAARRIVSAAGAVEKIGQGELDTRLSVPGTDEIAMLCGNINKMTGKLQTLLRERQISASLSSFLAEITATPVSDRSQLEDLFEFALSEAREILQADRTLIYRITDDTRGYITHESLGWEFPSLLEQNITEPLISQQLLQECLKKGEISATDLSNAGLHFDRLRIKAHLVVPILQQKKLYGLLIAHHCNNTYQWQTREIDFMKQLAAHLGITLDRISLLEQSQHQLLRSETLKDISLKIASSSNAQEIYDIALRQLSQVLGADRAVVLNSSSKQQEIVLAEIVDSNWPSVLENFPPNFYGELENLALDNVSAIASVDRADITPATRKELKQLGIQAYLVTPILVGSSVESFLIVSQQKSRHWETVDIDLVTQVATQAGLALERANLLQQQKAAKEQIQNRALRLLEEIDPISQGNLTVSAKVTSDEIGTVADFYNATVESLRKIVVQVKAASHQVAASTKNNQTSVRSLSEGAQQQTQDIEAALTRIQAMTDSISKVAANAKEASAAAQQASFIVTEGENAVERTVKGMVGIRETVAQTAKKLKRLGESSQKISTVVNLINNFTEQTHLLALNASIEAAHAGEVGRGFAVVAEEVRGLAQRSAEATAEIEEIVANIQIETNEVVVAMEAGTSQVVAGTVLVDETHSCLEKIADASSKIKELVEAIAESAAMQYKEEAAVSQTMVEVATISQQNSASATCVSQSFAEMLAVAERLQESVDRFKVE